MMTVERRGDYRVRGDYHRGLDPDWSYTPIYRRKTVLVDQFVGRLPEEAELLDVGAGEGVLVDRYRAQGRHIIGIDANYDSPTVQKGDLLSLPFSSGSFDAVLCLDVLEHIGLLAQAGALGEIHRVLKEGGTLLLSVPNLAHLHSRVRFALTGKLTRTSAVERHPGDRPVAEYLQLLKEARFQSEKRKGIFPTVPLLFRLVNHHPARFGWLVTCLDRMLPLPGLCFLNLIEARRI
jgi:2-polyprenyl-3-methyl-5-hydroxy-6-metoxy-1,4-benzoquinol methylase